MRRLDQRGMAAFEFCLVSVPIFILMFAIFDFGRYAITMQSLRGLADAGARSIMINCYATAVIQKTTPNCSGDPLSDAQKQDAAPYLYINGSSTPSLNATAGAACHRYGISTRLHHDHADLGIDIEQPDRVHENSLLAGIVPDRAWSTASDRARRCRRSKLIFRIGKGDSAGR